MTQFTVSGKNNPCPVCDRTADGDCRTMEQGNLVLCHTLLEMVGGDKDDPINGYKFLRKSEKGAGWGVWAWAEEKPKKIRPAVEPRTTYDYNGRSGSKLIRVQRQKGKSPEFWQEYFIEDKWVPAGRVPDVVKATMRSSVPIYRYAEVQEAIAAGKTIVWVEGESAADALWGIGIPATTSIGGSGGYRSWGNYSEDLAGAVSVAIAPDRDEQGLKYAQEVATAQGIKSWLWAFPKSPLWKLPLPQGGGLDVVDWIEDGATALDIIEAVSTNSDRTKICDRPKTTGEALNSQASVDTGYADLRLAVSGAMAYADPVERDYNLLKVASRHAVPMTMVKRIVKETSVRYSDRKTSFKLHDLMMLESEGSNWLIPRFLPANGLLLLSGLAKDGKSTLLYDMLRAVVKQEEFLGEVPLKQCRVLWIQAEENEFKIRENVEGAGLLYDPEVLLRDPIRFEQNWAIDDLDRLEQWVVEFHPDVIFFDSLRALSKTSGLSENSQEFANPVYELQSRLKEMKIPGVMIHHNNKNKEALGLASIAGSSAIPGACDDVIQLVRCDENPESTKRHIKLSGRNIKGRYSINFIPGEYPCFRWEVEQEIGVSPEDKKLSDRILDALRLNSRPLTSSEIMEVLGLAKESRSLFKPLKHLTECLVISFRRRSDRYKTKEYFMGDPPPLP
jgi:hypothetical protein